MRLLVLGASGGIGSWVVRLAAERGHRVTALVRSASALTPPPSASVRIGDVADQSALDESVAGHDAVLSCLGLRRAGRSPWAPLLSPPDLTERVTRGLVGAMRRHRIPRVIAVSAGGVADSYEQLTWPVKQLVTRGNIAVAYRDLAAMETVLSESGLDWLAVRPVTLRKGSPAGRAGVVDRYRLASSISRGDVSDWMLHAAERRQPLAERRVLLGS